MMALPRLTELLAAQAHNDIAADDADVQTLLSLIIDRHGNAVRAVLLYGSYLRGTRGTLLDFYVLVDDYAGALPAWWQRLGNRLLPPNVYYLQQRHADGRAINAKYAVVSVPHFEHLLANDFHSYFWARFTQPCALIWTADSTLQGRVAHARASAVASFARRVLPLFEGSAPFSAAELWRRGLNLTYGCELRSEGAGKGTTLVDAEPEYWQQLTSALAQDTQWLSAAADGRWFATLETSSEATLWGWRVRRWQGKLLSVLRLIKGALTFNDPLDYVLWKIERHSGVHVEPTPLQRRWPLLFAWPLLWRVYRRGGFR
ncbi:MAG: hypothetical protein H6978_12025 [Gammaproteobacteria bacterium]|nr:hypothetical protein [Gammaproteobacteria bacterium]